MPPPPPPDGVRRRPLGGAARPGKPPPPPPRVVAGEDSEPTGSAAANADGIGARRLRYSSARAASARVLRDAGVPARAVAALAAQAGRRGAGGARLPIDPTRAGRLAARWPELVRLFGSTDAAARALARRPALIRRLPGALEANLGALQRALRLERAADAARLASWCPQLVDSAAERLPARLAALAAALGVSEDTARATAARQPSLLLADPRTLAARVDAVAAGLEMPREDARQLLLASPMVLNHSARALASKCAALMALDGVAPAVKSQIALGTHGVLMMGEQKVKERWQYLSAAAAASPRWRRELPRLKGSSLAQLLCSSERRLARLRFLFEAGEAASAPLCGSVVMADALFEARFPGYASWAAAEEARRLEAEAAAAAAAAAAAEEEEQRRQRRLEAASSATEGQQQQHQDEPPAPRRRGRPRRQGSEPQSPVAAQQQAAPAAARRRGRPRKQAVLA